MKHAVVSCDHVAHILNALIWCPNSGFNQHPAASSIRSRLGQEQYKDQGHFLQRSFPNLALPEKPELESPTNPQKIGLIIWGTGLFSNGKPLKYPSQIPMFHDLRQLDAFFCNGCSSKS